MLIGLEKKPVYWNVMVYVGPCGNGFQDNLFLIPTPFALMNTITNLNWPWIVALISI